MPSRFRSPRSRGFTLVELLVVIGIIGVLAALITVAAGAAMRAAKETQVKVEVQNLAGAFASYKAKYGAYPPNFTNFAAVKQHLVKAFPRTTENYDTLFASNKPDAAEAVVFWLSGFSANPQAPLTGDGGPLSSTAGKSPLYEFDQTRLSGTGMDRTYRPAKLKEPFVYFDVSREATSSIPNYSLGNGVAEPYVYLEKDGTTKRFMNPTGIQILAAGLDDHWGAAAKPIFPTGPFVGNEADNIASISDKNMEDSMP